uniref:Uncharacterized protein n=1 Tax=Ditylenchus dipsaci TaxID=166011 RepID=A0A915EAG7_9BILA
MARSSGHHGVKVYRLRDPASMATVDAAVICQHPLELRRRISFKHTERDMLQLNAQKRSAKNEAPLHNEFCHEDLLQDIDVAAAPLAPLLAPTLLLEQEPEQELQFEAVANSQSKGAKISGQGAKSESL